MRSYSFGSQGKLPDLVVSSEGELPGWGRGLSRGPISRLQLAGPGGSFLAENLLLSRAAGALILALPVLRSSLPSFSGDLQRRASTLESSQALYRHLSWPAPLQYIIPGAQKQATGAGRARVPSLTVHARGHPTGVGCVTDHARKLDLTVACHNG